MTIYTYDTAKSISAALNLRLIEDTQFSDQALYELLEQSENLNIPGSYARSCSNMSLEEKRSMTKAANHAKRGMKESDRSRGLKSVAQTRRFANMSDAEKTEHGKKSRAGMSEDGKKRQVAGMLSAFSPARQKGIKQPIVSCPYCDKNGGKPIMMRYHFDNCKSRSTYN